MNTKVAHFCHLITFCFVRCSVSVNAHEEKRHRKMLPVTKPRGAASQRATNYLLGVLLPDGNVRASSCYGKSAIQGNMFLGMTHIIKWNHRYRVMHVWNQGVCRLFQYIGAFLEQKLFHWNRCVGVLSRWRMKPLSHTTVDSFLSLSESFQNMLMVLGHCCSPGTHSFMITPLMSTKTVRPLNLGLTNFFYVTLSP